MTVLQFTYNSTGKYALVNNDNIIGQAFIFNSMSELITTVNSIIPYQLQISGANYILKGKAGKNYLSAITIVSGDITAISWSTNANAALSTNDVNQAISIAQIIGVNF